MWPAEKDVEKGDRLLERLARQAEHPVAIIVKKIRTTTGYTHETGYVFNTVEALNAYLGSKCDSEFGGYTYIDQRGSNQPKGVSVGDTFSDIQNSKIINRSFVEGAFNKVKSAAGEETANALLKVAKAVEQSGNKEAGEILDQFNEELAKPEPRKSLLKRSWDNLVQVLPTVARPARIFRQHPGTENPALTGIAPAGRCPCRQSLRVASHPPLFQAGILRAPESAS